MSDKLNDGHLCFRLKLGHMVFPFHLHLFPSHIHVCSLPWALQLLGYKWREGRERGKEGGRERLWSVSCGHLSFSHGVDEMQAMDHTSQSEKSVHFIHILTPVG